MADNKWFEDLTTQDLQDVAHRLGMEVAVKLARNSEEEGYILSKHPALAEAKRKYIRNNRGLDPRRWLVRPGTPNAKSILFLSKLKRMIDKPNYSKTDFVIMF